jgi:FtsH-binding integral membrane protein
MKSLYNKIFGGSAKGNTNVFELMVLKKEFLALIFLNLLLQLSITYFTMETNTKSANKYNFWVLFGSAIFIIFILSYRLHPVIAFLLFSAFSYISGLLLSGIKKNLDEKQIRIAIENALSVFGAMFVTAIGLLMGGVNLGYKFGIFLFFSLIGLIIFRLINLFSGFGFNSLLNIMGVLIFALYILYDTHTILLGNYGNDFINASMSYYLDIINLFTIFLDNE